MDLFPFLGDDPHKTLMFGLDCSWTLTLPVPRFCDLEDYNVPNIPEHPSVTLKANINFHPLLKSN